MYSSTIELGGIFLDLSTWLSIIGIVLTCVGFFVTVKKTKTIHNNSHNRNVIGSFNTTNSTDKRKTIYNHHEHHEHHHHSNTSSPSPTQKTSTGGSDDIGVAFLLGVLAVAFFGLSIFFFIQYKELIMRSMVGIMAIGLFTAISIVYFKNTIQAFYKFYLIAYWLIVFGMVIIINNPLYPPKNLEVVISKFSKTHAVTAPKMLWNLLNNGYQLESFFLIFQISGLSILIFSLLSYFTLIFKLLSNKPLPSVKSIIIENIVIILVSFIFISGAFAKFIFFLQSPHK